MLGDRRRAARLRQGGGAERQVAVHLAQDHDVGHPCSPSRVCAARIGQDGPVRTVEEHQAVVAALLAPLGGEEAPLAAAHNRVLPRDVTA